MTLAIVAIPLAAKIGMGLWSLFVVGCLAGVVHK